MREILFRGKRCDNGEWVQGYYIRAAHHWHKHGIHEDWITLGASANGGWFVLHNKYAVKSETVGQFTGLTAKGKKIFEGDIVAQNWYDHDEPSDDSFGEVVFCEYDCSFSVMDIQKDGIVPLGRCHAYHWEAEVIGNIHDNPELLGGEEDGNTV